MTLNYPNIKYSALEIIRYANETLCNNSHGLMMRVSNVLPQERESWLFIRLVSLLQFSFTYQDAAGKLPILSY